MMGLFLLVSQLFESVQVLVFVAVEDPMTQALHPPQVHFGVQVHDRDRAPVPVEGEHLLAFLSTAVLT